MRTPRVKSKVARRLAKLSTVEVLEWADQVGSGTAKALDDYRRLGLAASLDEAAQGADALMEIVALLKQRAG